jgi:hypothetical protein
VGVLDAGGDMSDPVAGHLATLFLKPPGEAVTVDEDDVVAPDQPSFELVPEDHHRLDEANISLLHDVLL